MTGALPPEDAFIVTLQLRDTHANELWPEGRPMRAVPSKAGEMAILDLNLTPQACVRDPFDCLQLYIPRAALDVLIEDLGGPTIGALRLPSGVALHDPVVAHLGACFLPILEQPEHTTALFVDHLAMALGLHVARVYGGARVPPQRRRGWLSPKQLGRAKELLRSRLDGEVSLEQLARECNLSRSHFSRAFKQTTGQTPHRWLVAQRLAASRDLLVDSSLSLPEVARRCGFTDQSHFSKVFAKAEGLAPGAWRRLRRP
jgi:AraC family transcriptional regulator